MVGGDPNLGNSGEEVWTCDDLVSLAGMVKGVYETAKGVVAGRSE
jgi:hypothetical protein